MAEKRMTARKVVCSDLFLHLPPTSQAFYYLMLHNADDDGLVDNVDCLLRLQGFHPTTLSDLLKTAFVLDLGDSVYALRHWHVHNYIARDRYHPTQHRDKLALLELDDAKLYQRITAAPEEGKHFVNILYTESREDERRSDEVSGEETRGAPATAGDKRSGKQDDSVSGNVSVSDSNSNAGGKQEGNGLSTCSSGIAAAAPTKAQIAAFAKAQGLDCVDIDRFFRHYTERGWKNHAGRPLAWQLRLAEWDKEDRSKRAPPSDSPVGSFDVDDFFEAAVRRSYDIDLIFPPENETPPAGT